MNISENTMPETFAIIEAFFSYNEKIREEAINEAKFLGKEEDSYKTLTHLYNEMVLSDNIEFIRDHRGVFLKESCVKNPFNQKEITLNTTKAIIKELVLDYFDTNINKKDNFKLYTYERGELKYIVKFFIYKNIEKESINIKIIDKSYVFSINKFDVGIEKHNNSIMLQSQWKDFLEYLVKYDQGGITIVAGKELFKRKNFVYSLINFVNSPELEIKNQKVRLEKQKHDGIISEYEYKKKIEEFLIFENTINRKKGGKLLSLEEKIEHQFENDNCLMIQKQYTKEELDQLWYINPHFVFIGVPFNDEIIDTSIDLALDNKKVILVVNTTDINRIKAALLHYSNNNILNNYEIFRKYFKYLIAIEQDSFREAYIDKILNFQTNEL
jgi:hypothetical protein